MDSSRPGGNRPKTTKLIFSSNDLVIPKPKMKGPNRTKFLKEPINHLYFLFKIRCDNYKLAYSILNLKQISPFFDKSIIDELYQIRRTTKEYLIWTLSQANLPYKFNIKRKVTTFLKYVTTKEYVSILKGKFKFSFKSFEERKHKIKSSTKVGKVTDNRPIPKEEVLAKQERPIIEKPKEQFNTGTIDFYCNCDVGHWHQEDTIRVFPDTCIFSEIISKYPDFNMRAMSTCTDHLMKYFDFIYAEKYKDYDQRDAKELLLKNFVPYDVDGMHKHPMNIIFIRILKDIYDFLFPSGKTEIKPKVKKKKPPTPSESNSDDGDFGLGLDF